MSRLIIAVALLVACSPPPKVQPKSSCGASCSTSQDCSDFFGGCRSCNFGKCSAILPAQPTTDGGASDAPATSH